MTAALNPDCAAGKCGGCSGTAWSNDADALVDCEHDCHGPQTPTEATPPVVASVGPLVITVTGTPAPQGSKRHVGHGVMVESSKKVKPWREAVKWAALDVLGETAPLDGPLNVVAAFYLTRPRAHYRTGKNAHELRDGAPFWVGKRPDLDKLLRSTFDALGEAGCWADDAQVAIVLASKAYADHRPPGATITLSRIAS